MTQTLRFVKTQELEESALVLFEFDEQLGFLLVVAILELVDASVVLPDKALEIG